MYGFQTRAVPNGKDKRYDSPDVGQGVLDSGDPVKMVSSSSCVRTVPTPSHNGEESPWSNANAVGADIGNRNRYSPLMVSALTGRRPVGEYRR